MNNIITVIRSLIFNLACILWFVILTPLLVVVTFLPKKFSYYLGRIIITVINCLLHTICGLKCEIKGKEHIPKTGPFIVASKHQSALETLLIWQNLPDALYVLKAELMNIPFYGRYFKKMGMIGVDRKGKMAAMKNMLKSAEQRFKENHVIIIFPEGTRTNPGEKVKYHPGIVAIYNNNNLPVIPVALNTGILWSKNSFLKKSGNCIIEFLPLIPAGLEKEIFAENLVKAIEGRSIELYNNVNHHNGR